MNKLLKLFAVIFTIALFATSCSKDSNNGKTNEEKLLIGTWIDRNHIVDAEWTFSSDGKLTIDNPSWYNSAEHGTWSYEPSSHMLYRDFRWGSNTLHYSDIIQSITEEHMITIGMDGNITNFNRKH